MIDKLAHVQVVVENVNSMISSAKKEFAEVMADKSYPLEDRWNLFIETSDAFKEHEPFIVHFDFEKKIRYRSAGSLLVRALYGAAYSRYN